MTPVAAADPGNNGNPFVRCGYNYYPQSKTTTTISTGGGNFLLPTMTFASATFTAPNPPGGPTQSAQTFAVQQKLTQVNLNLADAVDSLKTMAQVNHKYGDTIEDSVTKLEYDLYYIKNLSSTLDAYIIFQTLKIILLTRGAQ